MRHPDAVRRAGHTDGNALFAAILASPSGVVFTEDDHADDFTYMSSPDGRFRLAIAELLQETAALRDAEPGWTTADFPFVLSAGERRAYTANDIFRDPAWRKRDEHGALRIAPEDAQALGLAAGDRAAITTAAGRVVAVVDVTDAMQPGHVSLPNGYGLRPPGEDAAAPGVAPNALTSSHWRDALAGTPWHKHVPARIEPALS
jgi:formate dehydrogenase